MTNLIHAPAVKLSAQVSKKEIFPLADFSTLNYAESIIEFIHHPELDSGSFYCYAVDVK